MLVICWLAYRLFQGIDDGLGVGVDLILAFALASAIAGMVLFIRHYLRRQSGPNEK